jgi:excisionase family DNA binding protein
MPSALQSRQDVHRDVDGLRSVPAVAQFLAISRSKVYQLMETGKLAYVKIGKSRRLRWSDVLKLVEENTVGRSDG